MKYRIILYQIILFLVACKHSPKQDFIKGRIDTLVNKEHSYFKDINLGIPVNAVFYLAEVSLGREPEANKRWAILENGSVIFSSNTAPFKFENLPHDPFNQPYDTICNLPLKDVRQISAELDQINFYISPSKVSAPKGDNVNDEWYYYIFSKLKDDQNAVKYNSEAPEAQVISAIFFRKIEEAISHPSANGHKSHSSIGKNKI